MPRLQDMLFVALAVALVILLAFHLKIAVLALVGAFACGSIYLFAGMIPSRNEGFCNRVFVSVFLSIVASSLVLILPGTLGVHRPDMENTVIAIAALLPVAAICFEIVRTPRVMQAILRCLGHR